MKIPVNCRDFLFSNIWFYNFFVIFEQTFKKHIMYTINPKTKEQLFWLLISVDYDLKRIVIADHSIDDHTLDLWLEDKQDCKESLDLCLELNISLHEFADFITRHKHNYYEGTGRGNTEQGRVFNGMVKINEPVKFYVEDATSVHQQWMREEMVEELCGELIASAVHG